MDKEKDKKIVQMPQREQMPPEEVVADNATSQPSEIEIRAKNEMAMLEHTARMKQMQAQMKPKIDSKTVTHASEILRKYKEGKVRLEKKIIANEEFWKLRQWKLVEDDSAEYQPLSPVCRDPAIGV